jgi:hypothetical protein
MFFTEFSTCYLVGVRVSGGHTFRDSPAGHSTSTFARQRPNLLEAFKKEIERSKRNRWRTIE